MSAMTLEQFRATGRDVLVLADIPECDGWEGGGRVYNGCLVIQRMDGDAARWCLTIGNSSEAGNDLAALEVELYQWALGEGVLDGPVTPPNIPRSPTPVDTLIEVVTALVGNLEGVGFGGEACISGADTVDAVTDQFEALRDALAAARTAVQS